MATLGTSRVSSASSSTSSFPGAPAAGGLNVDDLDEEEKKVLDEVQQKGYYHGRPRNAPGPAPKRLDGQMGSSTAPCRTSCQVGGLDQADPVDWVMNARDQYALLGALASASQVDLRRCYLRLATELHPSGVGHDSKRTEAFRRTAAAWAELGDQGARWRYDMELHGGRGLLVPAVEEGQVHTPPPMDLQKALGVFVFETWVCGNSSIVPLEFSETLQRAQKLVDDQEKGRSSGSGMQVAPQSVATGFAMSAGLLAVGCAATAAGYPAVGALARRGAICQGISQAAIASSIAWQQGSDGIAEGLRPKLEQARRLRQDCAHDPLAALMGIGGLTCLPRQKDRPTDEVQDASEDSESSASEKEEGSDEEAEDSRVILPGDMVRLCGLQAFEGLNGRLAHVVTVPCRGKRIYRVKVLPPAVRLGLSSAPASKVLNVQKANLQLANEGSSPESSLASQRMDGALTSGTQFL
eukprot:TRINITY_DN94237_c0_g1_i1.p1 TRINITY_DN94237_c0_g1~~TRINITY_DN94237_c0_g1_i1.p1  ORF type:complete len:467 (+),score=78.99 TRINITY_DN94237_c0_g1_i1:58-1458(+)